MLNTYKISGMKLPDLYVPAKEAEEALHKARYIDENYSTMQRTKTIVVDFDSVLNDLLLKWVTYLNNKHRLNMTLSDMKHWDMRLNFPMLTSDEIYAALYDTNFWESISLYPGVKDLLERMKNCGYRILIATDTDYKSIKIKWEHCLIPLLGDIIPLEDIIVTKHKDLIRCDYIIDDCIDNIKWSTATRILIDYPYNQCASDDSYEFRVENLNKAFAIINETERT